MPQDEFEEKYYSLSRSDMSKVAEAIHGMESELMNNTLSDEDDDVDDDDDDESLSADDAALIWASNGKDEDYMFGYSESELEEAF